MLHKRTMVPMRGVLPTVGGGVGLRLRSLCMGDTFGAGPARIDGRGVCWRVRVTASSAVDDSNDPPAETFASVGADVNTQGLSGVVSWLTAGSPRKGAVGLRSLRGSNAASSGSPRSTGGGVCWRVRVFASPAAAVPSDSLTESFASVGVDVNTQELAGIVSWLAAGSAHTGGGPKAGEITTKVLVGAHVLARQSW